MPKHPITAEDFYYILQTKGLSEKSIYESIESLVASFSDTLLPINSTGNLANRLFYEKSIQDDARLYAKRVIETWKENKRLTETDIMEIFREAIIIYTVLMIKVLSKRGAEQINELMSKEEIPPENGGENPPKGRKFSVN